MKLNALFPLGVSVCLAVSCVGTTPASDTPPPDLNLITVFYPMELKVYARGAANAIPPGADGVRPNCLYIAAHPSNRAGTVVPVNGDGSFRFEVSASSADVLELAAYYAGRGESCEVTAGRLDRGAAVYLEVPAPPGRLYAPEFTCCYATANDPRGGLCVRPQTDEGSQCKELPGECYSPGGGAQCGGPPADLFVLGDLYKCERREDCARFSFQTLSLSDSVISISKPRPDGLVTVTGHGEGDVTVPEGTPRGLPPRTLIRVENRTQPTTGRPTRPVRQFVVTDDQGRFQIDVRGRGDDEFVFRLFALDGSRSPEQAVYVPDADFEHGEISGVYPYRTIYPGLPPPGAEAGKIAIRFSLFGADGRGLCPDSATSENEPGPALCFSANTPEDGFKGGLDFGAVELIASVGNVADPTQVLAPSRPNASLPYVKFVDGDITAPAQTVALIVDNSDVAIERDPAAFRFRAAATLINSLRSRDRLSLWVIEKESEGDPCGLRALRGPGQPLPTGMRCVLPPTDSKAALLAALTEVEFPPGATPEDPKLPGGASKPMESIFQAVLDLNGRSVTNGRVVLLTLDNPPNPPSEFFEIQNDILALSEPNLELNRPGYPVVILSYAEFDPTRETFAHFVSTADFTGGVYQHVDSARAMLEVAGRMVGSIAGAFVLLYDLQLPAELANDQGKIADITLSGSILIEGIRRPLAPFQAQIPFGDRPN